MCNRKLLVGLIAILALGCNKKSDPRVVDTTPGEEGIAVYFDPKECRKAIVRAIEKAQNRIELQAYSFTSDDIAKALINAHRRGVKVTVIIDAEKADKKSEVVRLTRRDIETYIDSEHEKAHNKVILIDSQTVITGSFNFNDPRVESAENLLVIHDKPKLIKAYEDNFREHLRHSEKVER